MRVLYGVVGEGMGHATRSRVVLEHLVALGHEIKVVVSGKAHKFLQQSFAGLATIEIIEIQGLSFVYEGADVDFSESVLKNIRQIPKSLRTNLDVYADTIEKSFRPDVVFSDFESWAYLYARVHQVPVISVDNQQIIARCAHLPDVSGFNRSELRILRSLIKVKLPRAYHFLITSFFFPRVKKARTTLVPPILRREILEARREPEEHILVYQTTATNHALLPLLRRLPYEFRVYGMGGEGVDGNITHRPFSPTQFVDDLRTARAVVASAGFSLMCEAVHLHVPMLALPLRKQFEQVLNARYLEKLGYGMSAETLSEASLTSFLESTALFAARLESYEPRDNTMLLECVDELLDRVLIGAPAPRTLKSLSMATYKTHDRA